MIHLGVTSEQAIKSVDEAMIQVLLSEIEYLRLALAEARATMAELKKETEGETNKT